MNQKIKLDPDMTLRDFLMLHASMVDYGGESWTHTDKLFHWNGVYLCLVDRIDAPYYVWEDLLLTNQSPNPENNHQ